MTLFGDTHTVSRQRAPNSNVALCAAAVVKEGSGGEWTEFSTMVTYNASYHFYWGQMPGLIKALPTSAETYSKRQRVEFKWGMPHTYQRHRIMKISAKLQPGTSSNISVWAYKTRR